MKQIAILGSTGSIGTQTLDVVRQHPSEFSVYALSAHRSLDLLIQQALEFNPAVVCIADERLYQPLREALSDLPIKVMAGEKAISEMVTMPAIDVVVAAMVGYAGLRPTIEAIKAKKTIALANKETLVVAGEIICRLAQRYKVPILPVDSEHSAIFQSLVGEEVQSIEKLLLTASGGPFRTFTYEQMQHVTAAQALKHPNWEMGAKITIDSASMMNKGFEVIEARWLFDIPVEKIQVLVHPQSVVHSAVQFVDGSVKAQLGTPDMRMPIQYALTYPHRWPSDVPQLDLFSTNQLTFEEPDLQRFPNLRLAYEAMKKGGNMPCILNAANEVVNLAFREEKCGFLQMSDVIAKTMERTAFIAEPTYEDYVLTDTEARKIATETLKLFN
ncbi:MAG: 1-deoxy-D-xylulose-5-phosphate reductoisomerase [Paludibacteraceae bacterium]|nr:1-deoxy-D-xylulose-5-phosphate reductoisomerase [Paludibacteraceae bacterium]MBQ9143794.1 1-deoxy-D-xylulose-5-phosphate reductoisomerase [Paludibacteraceae bacterium]